MTVAGKTTTAVVGLWKGPACCGCGTGSRLRQVHWTGGPSATAAGGSRRRCRELAVRAEAWARSAEGLRPTSVMIVDDQRYARLGLALMIRKAPDLRVVAEAGDGQEALEVLEELNRSTGLPTSCSWMCVCRGMDGISATRAMARRFRR